MFFWLFQLQCFPFSWKLFVHPKLQNCLVRVKTTLDCQGMRVSKQYIYCFVILYVFWFFHINFRLWDAYLNRTKFLKILSLQIKITDKIKNIIFGFFHIFFRWIWIRKKKSPQNFSCIHLLYKVDVRCQSSLSETVDDILQNTFQLLTIKRWQEFPESVDLLEKSSSMFTRNIFSIPSPSFHTFCLQ